MRRIRLERQRCDCDAYHFPHRSGGGDCGKPERKWLRLFKAVDDAIDAIDANDAAEPEGVDLDPDEDPSTWGIDPAADTERDSTMQLNDKVKVRAFDGTKLSPPRAGTVIGVSSRTATVMFKGQDGAKTERKFRLTDGIEWGRSVSEADTYRIVIGNKN